MYVGNMHICMNVCVCVCVWMHAHIHADLEAVTFSDGIAYTCVNNAEEWAQKSTAARIATTQNI